jgi:hypothetical protein
MLRLVLSLHRYSAPYCKHSGACGVTVMTRFHAIDFRVAGPSERLNHRDGGCLGLAATIPVGRFIVPGSGACESMPLTLVRTGRTEVGAVAWSGGEKASTPNVTHALDRCEQQTLRVQKGASCHRHSNSMDS